MRGSQLSFDVAGAPTSRAANNEPAFFAVIINHLNALAFEANQLFGEAGKVAQSIALLRAQRIPSRLGHVFKHFAPHGIQ